MALRDHTQEEIAAAPANRQVGTTLWYENDRVKVWEIRLAPGERTPLHCHATDYFWTCVEPGRALTRMLDGGEDVAEIGVGDVEFLTVAPGRPLIHDLTNVGDTLLRFVTVELK
jgi:hypothetical protein